MSFLQQAESIFEQNTTSFTLEAHSFQYITPSKDFYQHHWLWDSAVHAMALAYINEKKAQQELEMIFLGQWENGHIGHIRFNPQVKGYFPGAEVWETSRFKQDEVVSSGITQPPLIAVALRHLLTVTKDKEETKIFVKKLLPKLKKYHNYLQKTRDPQNTGLIYIIHPWESGMDNSPRFDIPLSKIQMSDIPQEVIQLVKEKRSDDIKQNSEERPLVEDYYKYIYLVNLYANWNWEVSTIIEKSPFRVIDIAINSIWCRANSDLAFICEQLNDPEAVRYQKLAETTLLALEPLYSHNSSTIDELILPFAGEVKLDMLNSIIHKLSDPKQFATPYPVPSVSVSDSRFELERYWRGPTWPITNLLIIEGLNFQKTHESELVKTSLIQKTTAMIEKFGFWEYFQPLTGKDENTALGFSNFSWTAAIYIFLKHKYG